MSLVNVDSSTLTIAVDKARIMQALGLDARDPMTQTLLLVCERYGLDPLLRHIIMIEGKPFVTRDGYLFVAHRNGQLDGIDVVAEGDSPQEWWARVTVWRKDMSRGFTYRGRFPKPGRKGKEHAYGPEMAVKCAESMALRRAFPVAGLPSADERHSGGLVEIETHDGTEWANSDQIARVHELSTALDDAGKAQARSWVDARGIQLNRMSSEQADAVVAMLLGLVGSDLPDEPVARYTDGPDGGADDSPPVAAPPEGDHLERVGGGPVPMRLNRKLMALAVERIVVPDDIPKHEIDDYRRHVLLGYCADLGYPGLVSRKQIGAGLAQQLCDQFDGSSS